MAIYYHNDNTKKTVSNFQGFTKPEETSKSKITFQDKAVAYTNPNNIDKESLSDWNMSSPYNPLEFLDRTKKKKKKGKKGKKGSHKKREKQKKSKQKQQRKSKVAVSSVTNRKSFDTEQATIEELIRMHCATTEVFKEIYCKQADMIDRQANMIHEIIFSLKHKPEPGRIQLSEADVRELEDENYDE